MKKTVIAALFTLIMAFNANAQTVIRNNYDAPSTSNKSEQKTSDSFGSFNLHYMSFDGFENYGIVDYMINPNGVGMDWGIRACFEKHGNYNIDLGVNYSFELLNNDDFSGYLTLAVGPTFRMQDEIDGIDKHGNIEYKDGYFFDGFINPRLTLKYNHIVASVGYYYWAPKFKFSKDDGATGGLNIALGYAF